MEILEVQRKLIKKLIPLVEIESIFLTPNPCQSLNAFDVFDAIRELSTPQMSEREFNDICDEQLVEENS